jgi:hypothetical protein
MSTSSTAGTAGEAPAAITPSPQVARDPAFAGLLTQGAELLQRGQLVEARDVLERAVTMVPEDARGQNLLGVTYYRLGVHAPALEIYAYLTQVLPTQAQLRVNHALVLVRAERLEEARQELEQALLIDPLHRRAASVLGYVAGRQGDFRRARDAYRSVGAWELADQMSSQLFDPEPAPEYDEIEPSDLPIDVGPMRGGSAPRSTVPVSQLVDRFQVKLPPIGEPFQLNGDALVTRVERVVYQRLGAVQATIGDLPRHEEMRRYRGRAADAPFGTAKDPLFRITGPGALVARPDDGQQFLLMALRDDILYVREELVFAFDGQVVWENGRIPQRGGEEINLVHFRGKGKLALQVGGTLNAVRVEPERMVAVRLELLAGWVGRIVPKVVIREAGQGRWVECIGEGTLLLHAGIPSTLRAASVEAEAPGPQALPPAPAPGSTLVVQASDVVDAEDVAEVAESSPGVPLEQVPEGLGGDDGEWDRDWDK